MIRVEGELIDMAKDDWRFVPTPLAAALGNGEPRTLRLVRDGRIPVTYVVYTVTGRHDYREIGALVECPDGEADRIGACIAKRPNGRTKEFKCGREALRWLLP
jgi:hypothetical protein